MLKLKIAAISALILLPTNLMLAPKALASEMIGFAKVRSAIPSGSVIGERFCSTSLIRTRCGENKTNGLSEEAALGYRTVIEEELKKAGYKTSGAGGSIFEDVATEAAPARFLIGVTIATAKVNSLESENIFTSRRKWETKAEIVFRWELFDRQTNSVVFAKEITGKSEVPGEQVATAAYEATRSSIREMLSDPNFRAVLRSSGSSASVGTSN